MKNRQPSWIYRSDSRLYKLSDAILIKDLLGFTIGSIIAAVLTCSIAGCIQPAKAAPDRVPEKKQEQPKEEPIPSLIGETNWGTIGQNGRQLIIEGHPHWSATGQINKDGTISLNWIQLNTGATAAGHYRRTADGALEGKWGFTQDVTVNPDGTMSGDTRTDIIRWLEN